MLNNRKCELCIELRLHRYDTELSQMAGPSVEILGKIKRLEIVEVNRKDFSVFEIGYVCPE